jgi:hypothetical protein
MVGTLFNPIRSYSMKSSYIPANLTITWCSLKIGCPKKWFRTLACCWLYFLEKMHSHLKPNPSFVKSLVFVAYIILYPNFGCLHAIQIPFLVLKSDETPFFHACDGGRSAHSFATSTCWQRSKLGAVQDCGSVPGFMEYPLGIKRGNWTIPYNRHRGFKME